MTASDQWIRKCSVWVLPGADPNAGTDQGMDLSNFRIRFETFQAEWGDGAVPAHAWIRISNLDPKTEKKFIHEYSSVILQAGYEKGKFGVIFQGTIKQYRRGHESATDSYLDIYVADGDLAYGFAVVNQTHAAGWTNKQLRDDAAQKLGEYGVKLGYTGTGISTGALAALGSNMRGTTRWGMGQLAYTSATKQAGLTYTVENGKLNTVPLEGYMPGEAVKLSGRTGLIGWPEQTNDGINITCLLNPAIRVMNLIQIDNKEDQPAIINQSRFPGGGFELENIISPSDKEFLQPIANDGFYRVLSIKHKGDTRGNPWYSEIVAVEADLSMTGAKQGQAGLTDTTVEVPPPVADWGGLPKGDKPDDPYSLSPGAQPPTTNPDDPFNLSPG